MIGKITATLRRQMVGRLKRRSKRIDDTLSRMERALHEGQTDVVYEQLAEAARHVELLCRDLREALIRFYSDLQLVGMFPAIRPYPQTGEVAVALEDGCLSIKMPAMLPFPSHGSVHFLHEQVERALEQFILKHKLPRPFFTERCAVVFLHHYGMTDGELRHLRDYDNLEHRCITNVLAASLLWGDSPKCMISMDVLAPGDHNFTEVRLMPLPAFRKFVLSEKIEFKP